MKKIIIYFAALIIGFSAFTSCEDTNEDIIFSNSDKFIAFENTSFNVREEGSMIGIPVYIAGTKSGDGATVNFAFDTTGIENPAIEGDDFNVVNSDYSLSWNNYYGYDTIWVEPLDNNIYDKDKSVNIVLSNPSNNYNLGAFNTAAINIIDNEHPLGKWVGTFVANAASQGLPGDWDEVWTVTTGTVSGEPDKLSITGIAASPDIIYATVNKEEMTITLEPGQVIDNYSYGNYGRIGIYWGTYPDIDDQKQLVGTIYEDGSFYIPNWGHMFLDAPNTGIVWDVFDVTFNPAKTEGKSDFFPSKKNLENR